MTSTAESNRKPTRAIDPAAIPVGDADDRHDHIPCARQSRERAPSTAKLIEVVPRCDPPRVPDPACRGASDAPLSVSEVMLLCLSSGDWRVLEESPDAPGEEALDAADGLAFGLALSDSTGDVGAGWWVAALLGDGDE
jgi:hypothetical protein